MTRELNPHYDYDNPDNIAYTNAVLDYQKAFLSADIDVLDDAEIEALKGKSAYEVGLSVTSPWGTNKILEASIDAFEAKKDIVKKEITVKPGYMLSLQYHLGREETWEVIKGTLTYVSDGCVLTASPGELIKLPKNNIHCMINCHDIPVTVIETQIGACREADNVRLLDFNNRPTAPLQTKTEALSAIAYTKIHKEIEKKFGCETSPNMLLLDPSYVNIIENME